MATITIGTAGTTTLVGVPFGGLAQADIGAMRNSVRNDQVNGNPLWPGAFTEHGHLYVPNRGVLKILPGDYVGIDTKGWPILISALSAATAASWVHT